MTIPETFVRIDEPLTADVDGESVLLDPRTGDFFGLRGSAGVVWELVAEPQSVASLVSTLTAQYDVDEATCTADVERFVGELHEAGLLRSV